MSFPFYHQLDAMDCGPTCLRMIAKHYGKHYSLETLRKKCFIGRGGKSARHQFGRREYWFTFSRGAYFIQSTERGASALHSTLETEPFCGGL